MTPVRYQLLIIGLDSAGKSTLLEQLRHKHHHTPPPDALRIPPTVGLNIGQIDYGNVRLVLWDLGGQSGLRVLWDKYFSEAHAVIYVVDSTDTLRLSENRIEFEKVMMDRELADAPILLCLNKQDQIHAMGEAEIREHLGLPPPQQFASSSNAGNSNSTGSTNPTSVTSSTPSNINQIHVGNRPFRVQCISALNGKGISGGLDWLLAILPRCKRTKILKESLAT